MNLITRFDQLEVIPRYVRLFTHDVAINAERISDLFKVDLREVCALMQTESGGNSYSMRYEANFKWIGNDEEIKKIAQDWLLSFDTTKIILKSSFGLCQVMGQVAHELGLSKQDKNPLHLLDPYTGIYYGLMHYTNFRRRLKLTDPLDIYAAYNRGSVVKLDKDLYINQSAVNRFKKYLDEFQKK